MAAALHLYRRRYTSTSQQTFCARSTPLLLHPPPTREAIAADNASDLANNFRRENYKTCSLTHNAYAAGNAQHLRALEVLYDDHAGTSLPADLVPYTRKLTRPLRLDKSQLVPWLRAHNAPTLFSPTPGLAAYTNIYSHNSRPTSEPDPGGTNNYCMLSPQLKLSLRTPSPTRRPSRHHMSAGMLLRAPSSPAFYVHALTTTTSAEHWPLPACAAISSSGSTCLPPTRGAQPLLSDSGAYFHCRHKEAAVPRPPAPVPDARNAAAEINSRLVPNFYTSAPLLPAHSGHLPGPTAFVYHWCWPTPGTYLRSATPSHVPHYPLSPWRVATTRAASSPITLPAPLNSRLAKQNPLQTIARPPSGQRSAFSPQRHASPPAPRWPGRRPPHRDTLCSRASLWLYHPGKRALG
jgi:hypothetical protein